MRSTKTLHTLLLLLLLLVLLPVFPVLSGGPMLAADTNSSGTQSRYSISVDEEGIGLQALVELAASNNPELSDAYRSLTQARRNLEGPLTLGNTAFTVRGNYTYTIPEDDEDDSENDTNSVSGSEPETAYNTNATVSENTTPTHEWSGTMDLSIPVLPQITLGTGLTIPLFDMEKEEFPEFAEDEDDIKDITGTVSIIFNPFARQKNRLQTNEIYQKALKQVMYLENSIFYEVESATFDLLLAFKERDAAERTMELREQEYEIVKEQYTIDEDTTIDDVTDAADSYTCARQEYFTTEQSLLSTKQRFFTTLGIDFAEVIIKDISAKTLEKLVRQRTLYLEGAASMQAASLTLENLQSELETLDGDLKQTWVYRPDLSLSASLDVPTTQFGATISYSISPQDFKTDERKTLQENVEAKKQDIALELFKLDLAKEMAISNVQTFQEMAVLEQSALDDARTTLQETQLLYEQGERTALELEQAEVSLLSSDIKYLSTLCDLYNAQAEVLKLFPTVLFH